MKELLEQVSIALGYDGEINEQVDEWVEIAREQLGSNDEVIEFIRYTLQQWTRTGYFPAGSSAAD